jgi:16S rRNA (cytidine1402-2'-O)-methyltransferase
VVARELTKIHEEARAGTLGSLADDYRDAPPRGEVTLVVAGTGGTAEPADEAVTATAEVRQRARALLATGLSRRDVAAQLAEESGVSRNEAYRVVTTL